MATAPKTIRKAVIPAAGLGTRSLPFSKDIPKEMVPILNTPAIHFVAEEILAAGLDQIVLVSAQGKSSLENYFDYSPQLESWLKKRGKESLIERVRDLQDKLEVITVRQRQPLGLGHAVLEAKKVVGDEAFAVCLPDELFPPWNSTKARGLQSLVAASKASGKSTIGVLEVPLEETNLYGMIDVDGTQKGAALSVSGCVEKPKPSESPSRLAIIGRYVLQPEIFGFLEEGAPGVGGEIQLTDAIHKLAQKGLVEALCLEDIRYDVGNPWQCLKMQIDAGLRSTNLAQPLKQYIQELEKGFRNENTTHRPRPRSSDELVSF